MKAGTGKALEELAEMDVEQMVPILLAKVTPRWDPTLTPRWHPNP